MIGRRSAAPSSAGTSPAAATSFTPLTARPGTRGAGRRGRCGRCVTPATAAGRGYGYESHETQHSRRKILNAQMKPP